jgi:hypothetical protein
MLFLRFFEVGCSRKTLDWSAHEANLLAAEVLGCYWPTGF